MLATPVSAILPVERPRLDAGARALPAIIEMEPATRDTGAATWRARIAPAQDEPRPGERWRHAYDGFSHPDRAPAGLVFEAQHIAQERLGPGAHIERHAPAALAYAAADRGYGFLTAANRPTVTLWV